MPRNPSHADFETALVDLGAPIAELNGALSRPQSPADAEQKLADYKACVRRAWKKRAFELHPDRGGDAEQFKRMSATVDVVQALTLRARRRPVHYPIVTMAGGSDTTSTTDMTFGSGATVRFINFR